MKKVSVITNLLVASVLTASVLTANAQNPVESVPADTVKALTQEVAPALTFSGYVDAYYAYDFANPKSGTSPFGYGGSPANTRPGWLYNHNKVNEFNINLAMLRMNYAGSKVRAALSLQAGTYPQYNYAAEQGLLKNVYEAYAGFQLTEGIWLDAGIFPSHIGLESAITKDNWTLTRSIIAENTPYYLSGAKLSIQASPKLAVTLLVLNGWQNIQETSQNTNKAVGTQLQFKPSDKVLLNSSTFFGNEKPDTAKQYRIHHDFYATFQLSDAFSIAALFDIGSEEKADGDGRNWYYYPGLIARLKASDKVAFVARGEHYNDQDGVFIAVTDGSGSSTADGFQVSSGSLGIEYLPAANCSFRVEGRSFYSKGRGVFVDENGNSTRNNTVITTSLSVSF
ncbi:MAG: porin [Ferruginibacter sp.]|nr:porin [Cytophagales bacterium]